MVRVTVRVMVKVRGQGSGIRDQGSGVRGEGSGVRVRRRAQLVRILEVNVLFLVVLGLLSGASIIG